MCHRIISESAPWATFRNASAYFPKKVLHFLIPRQPLSFRPGFGPVLIFHGRDGGGRPCFRDSQIREARTPSPP
jgi:hypothetical protein